MTKRKWLKSKEIVRIRYEWSTILQSGPFCVSKSRPSRALTLANEWIVRSLTSISPSAWWISSLSRWTDQITMASDGFALSIVYQFDKNRLHPICLRK
jgi:hypothetical protein